MTQPLPGPDALRKLQREMVRDLYTPTERDRAVQAYIAADAELRRYCLRRRRWLRAAHVIAMWRLEARFPLPLHPGWF